MAMTMTSDGTVNDLLPNYITTEQSRAFQDLLREHRKRLGKTQMEVAGEAGVSQTLISTLERGPHVGMRVYDLFKVIRYYGIEPNEVAEVLGFLPTSRTLNDDEERRLSSLVKALKTLDPDALRTVEDALELMLRGAGR